MELLWKSFSTKARVSLVLFWVCIVATLFIQSGARSSGHFRGSSHTRRGLPRVIGPMTRSRKFSLVKLLGVEATMGPSSMAQPFAGSPFQLPPIDDSYGTIAPVSLPLNAPPFCVLPPSGPNPPSSTTPQTPIFFYEPPPPPPTPPSTEIPTPSPPVYVPGPPECRSSPPECTPSPPVSPVLPNPPEYVPSPPMIVPEPPVIVPSPPGYGPSPPEYVPGPPAEYVPSPPTIVPSPPGYGPSPPEYVPGPPEYVPSPPEYVPSPPDYVPGPPEYVPSPPEYVPGPPVFQPPVVYPPPAVPPPPSKSGQGFNLWCVAKPTVPDPIIQEAMNYVCGSGADCESIQPSGSCYQPDTLLSHASYAFNSYWQRTKVGGGTCDFGGVGMLITQDPSFDGCHFIIF